MILNVAEYSTLCTGKTTFCKSNYKQDKLQGEDYGRHL